MSDALDHLASFVSRHAGIGDKAKLCALVVEEFALTRDRSVFYSSDFAVRFSSAKSQTSLPNTILSLSSLHKFDDRPFVVCVVTPTTNRLLLANTTLLRKVSHSSHELRINNIRGSFNALELGIDIGGLDASVMAGWPGSLASALQQSGRAGRKLAPSLAVLVASSNPLDQYLINHPEYLYGGTPESGIVDPENLVVRLSHLKCAAFELPFKDDEPFGNGAEPTAELLELLAATAPRMASPRNSRRS